MSEENVEIVRAALDAWNRGDWEEALKYAGPNMELDNSTAIGEWRGVHRGLDEVMRVFERIVEPWESVRTDIDELIGAGENVVARTTTQFVGREGSRFKSVAAGAGRFGTVS